MGNVQSDEPRQAESYKVPLFLFVVSTSTTNPQTAGFKDERMTTSCERDGRQIGNCNNIVKWNSIKILNNWCGYNEYSLQCPRRQY